MISLIKTGLTVTLRESILRVLLTVSKCDDCMILFHDTAVPYNTHLLPSFAAGAFAVARKTRGSTLETALTVILEVIRRSARVINKLRASGIIILVLEVVSDAKGASKAERELAAAILCSVASLHNVEGAQAYICQFLCPGFEGKLAESAASVLEAFDVNNSGRSVFYAGLASNDQEDGGEWTPARRSRLRQFCKEAKLDILVRH